MKQRTFSSDSLLLCTVLIAIVGYSCNRNDEYRYPRFDTRQLDIIAIAGEKITLPCSVEYKKNYTVAWMNPKKILISQGDRRLMDDIRMTIERPLVPDWNLHIRTVRFSDRGMYTCTLNTKPVLIKRINLTVLECMCDISETNTEYAWLRGINVKVQSGCKQQLTRVQGMNDEESDIICYVPPDINEYWSSQNQIVKEGATVHLTCNATGRPAPEIRWFRKTVYSIAEKKDAIGAPGEILVIHNITRYCDGLYECVASNGVGDAVSKEINIEVQFPPEIHLLTKRMSQTLGKETILTCMISASPQAVGVWHKNGQKIESDWKIRSEIYIESPHTVSLDLKIMNLEEKDFGFYTCEASNVLGEDNERMLLYEEKPKTTTTPFVRVTADHITRPEIPKDRNNINSGRHRLQPTQNSKGKPYHNPKDPVYQYSGDNMSSRTHINIYLVCVLLVFTAIRL